MAFATAASNITLAPEIGPNAQNEYVDIIISQDPNACPTDYLFVNAPAPTTCYLLIIFGTAAYVGPFVGDFPIALGAVRGTSAAYTGCVDGTFDSSTNIHKSESGSVTITKFVEGAEVAGHFSVTMDDGTILASDFDVPFCSMCTGH